MNKNAIQKYAIWARNELIEQVKQRAYQYGISETGYGDEHATVVTGRVLSADEKHQRHAFVEEIKQSSYKQVVEEVAYTWFNRFVALRYMEVNDYLPTHIRVFSDAGGNFNPEILANVLHLDLPGLNKAKVSTLLNANATEELYSYLLLTQCNALNELLPEMFERMGAYTEMLLPNNILKPESVIGRLVNDIPEEDFRDAVQIIGWLYQYYNTEPKQAVFDGLKKNIKITKENIPAATQLFTPDWIVRYMVENSLGRLWYEVHPDETLKSNWQYFLDEADQEEAVQAQLDQIREEYKTLKPEEIKCIDPCMGSGHILVYMFDVLMQIYESKGYNPGDAVVSIVENNLYGLDIDERAAQLAYFAVMMKARQYDRRFLSRGIKPHLYAIDESNGLTTAPMHDMGLNLTEEEYELAVKQAMRLVEEMHDAKEYGSILNITPCDWDLLRRFAVPREASGQMMIDIHGEQEASRRLQHLINIGEAMVQKYDVVVTNPPYMGSKGMSVKLSDFVKKHYPDSKSDLFAVFIEKCGELLKLIGYKALITQHAWMFLSSYEKLRSKIITQDIVNMAHLGARAFEEIGGEVVQATAFVMSSRKTAEYLGTYVRLVDFNCQNDKEAAFLSGNYNHVATSDNFSKIPGSPVAYWVNIVFFECYNNPKISSVAFSDGQILTGNNDKYLRLIWEVESNKVSPDSDWVLHAKGGEFRRWYGNIDTVVSWNETSRKHYKEDKISRFPKEEILFRKGITWTLVSTNTSFGVRELQSDLTFNKAAATILFQNENFIPYVLGFLNSKVAQSFLRVINPTLNNNIIDILNMPLHIEDSLFIEVVSLVSANIEISQNDWDSFETSWGFKVHPLV